MLQLGGFQVAPISVSTLTIKKQEIRSIPQLCPPLKNSNQLHYTPQKNNVWYISLLNCKLNALLSLKINITYTTFDIIGPSTSGATCKSCHDMHEILQRRQSALLYLNKRAFRISHNRWHTEQQLTTQSLQIVAALRYSNCGDYDVSFAYITTFYRQRSHKETRQRLSFPSFLLLRGTANQQ